MAGFTTISTGTNLQAKELLRQLQTALNERSAAVGGSTQLLTLTVAGDNIQAATFWQQMQNAVATIIANTGARYIKAGTSGTPPTSLPNYEGLASIPTITTAGDLWALVTGNAGGPRRYTSTYGTGNPQAYGVCQPGDYIGKWLWEDLQKACKFLRYTVKTATGSVNYASKSGGGTVPYVWRGEEKTTLNAAALSHNTFADGVPAGYAAYANAACIAQHVMDAYQPGDSAFDCFSSSLKGTVTTAVGFTQQAHVALVYGKIVAPTFAPAPLGTDTFTFKNLQSQVSAENTLHVFYAEGSYNNSATVTATIAPTNLNFDTTTPINDDNFAWIFFGWQVDPTAYVVFDWQWLYT